MLNRKFKMKNLGAISLILGMKVVRTETTLTLSQGHYAEETLRKFGMWQSKRATRVHKRIVQELKSQELRSQEFNSQELNSQ